MSRHVYQDEKKETGAGFLRGLPFLLTIVLLFFLVLLSTGESASAENIGSSSDTEELPEYSISLSDVQCSSTCNSVTIDGSTITITEAGSYTLTGTLSDGQICVDTDKESKVRLILSSVHISNTGSAAVYVRSADKVILSLADGSSNTLETIGSFVQTDENNVDGAVFSKEDLTIKGSGSLTVNASGGHGIVSKDDLKITGGTVTVNAGKKALSANDSVIVENGILTLNAGTEGMEASNVVISGGEISIQAADDGINATWLSDQTRPAIEISGGSLTVVMGTGDTDGIDSNGDLSITGGSIDISGNSAFDVDGTITFTGGSVVVNGQQVDSIPNQMMGMGGFGRMNGGGMNSGDRNGMHSGMNQGMNGEAGRGSGFFFAGNG